MLPEHRTATSLIDVFRTTARAFPGATALTAEGTATTYAELDARSEALAARIRDAVLPGGLVGVLADRSAESVTAVLAVLKSGCGYVPVDPSYPAHRQRLLMRDTGVSLVVGRPGPGRAPDGDCTLIDPEDPTAPAPPAAVPHRVPVPDGTAYVIHTSGSTGTPKGCAVTHANVLALLRAALPLFDFGPEDRWTLFHSLSFDFSVWEMWGAFATGGALVVVPLEVARAPGEFARLLEAERVSVLSQTPSAFGYTSRALALPAGEGHRRALRHVVLGGERVALPDVREFLARGDGSGCAVTTMYGITETTVHATFKRLGPADLRDGAPSSPIGRPLAHIDLTLRDRAGNVVAPGGTGEIWISGPGVTAGYLGRDELNRSSFPRESTPAGERRFYRSGDLARALPDGQLDHVGRVDDQLKVMGFRIEPGEIESALRTHPGVRNAVVVAAPSPAGPSSLVACVVPEGAAERVSGRALREHLQDRLPGHLIPQRLRIFDEFPRTASGKTDRKAVLARVRDAL